MDEEKKQQGNQIPDKQEMPANQTLDKESTIFNTRLTGDSKDEK